MKRLKSEEEYQKALARLEDIFHAKAGSTEAGELDLLTHFIEKYESDTEEPFPNPIST